MSELWQMHNSETLGSPVAVRVSSPFMCHDCMQIVLNRCHG